MRYINMVLGEITKVLTSQPSSPRTKYGPQVDVWAAFIPDRGNLDIEIQNRVVKKMQAKGLNDLMITHEKLKFDDSIFTGGGREAREHIVFAQNLGGGGKATFTLRVAKRGADDLEISWRLFERNIRTELFTSSGPFIAVAILIVVILLISITNANLFSGLCMIIIGLLFVIGVSMRSLTDQVRIYLGGQTTSTHQQLDTQVLAVTVHHVLMLVLQELGVDPYELRVLQQTQIAGIGKP